MTTNGKIGLGVGAAVLVGAAAYAIFKYSTMSDEQKHQLVDNLKEKGKKFYDDNVSSLKNIFTRKAAKMNDYAHT